MAGDDERLLLTVVVAGTDDAPVDAKFRGATVASLLLGLVTGDADDVTGDAEENDEGDEGEVSFSS